MKGKKETSTGERPTPLTRTFAESIEETLARFERSARRMLGRGLVATTLVAAPTQALVGCAADVAPGGSGEPPEDDAVGGGKLDWAQDEGRRDTNMVRFDGDHWNTLYDCSSRAGCMSIDVFLKVRIRPVEGANLDRKRVGVVVVPPLDHPYGYPEEHEETTALGHYFTTHSDGTEEWHVRVYRRSWWSSYIKFDVWYQDGRGNTYFDDNMGEYHVVAYRGDHAVIWRDSSTTNVTIDDGGVHGSIEAILADLDYDKDVRLVWTTDDWATVHESAIGSMGEMNAWYWVEDAWSGSERWRIDLDIPGSFERFQYAIVYRHGANAGGRTYDFWDNGYGSNYVVQREPPPIF